VVDGGPEIGGGTDVDSIISVDGSTLSTISHWGFGCVRGICLVPEEWSGCGQWNGVVSHYLATTSEVTGEGVVLWSGI
jgi:hypothetical protein